MAPKILPSPDTGALHHGTLKLPSGWVSVQVVPLSMLTHSLREFVPTMMVSRSAEIDAVYQS